MAIMARVTTDMAITIAVITDVITTSLPIVITAITGGVTAGTAITIAVITDGVTTSLPMAITAITAIEPTDTTIKHCLTGTS